ncbi:hypothetical protein PM082_015736 [Marasmius tenuissimus]|nr:hypothetical protein PM082_015736 [Marasmius tenuissimus]
MDMDMDMDDSEGEAGCEGPQLHRCNLSGREEARSRETGHKSYARMDNSNFRSNAAETFTTGFGQAQSHAIASISPFEDSLPSSSRLPPTLPIGYITSGPYVVSLAGPSPLSRRPDSPTFEESCSPGLAWNPAADTATECPQNNRSSRKRNMRRMSQERGHPYALAYDTHNDGNRNETYNHSRVYKERKHNERSHSNAEIHLHLCGRESSLSASGPSSSPSASHTTQCSFQAPLLNRIPSPPSEKSHNEHGTSLPAGESKSPYTSHTTPSQDVLNPTPALPFEKSQLSMLRESAVTSPFISHATPDSSQSTLINSTPTPPFHGPNSSQQVMGEDQKRTRSERYESLLLRCKLGFPLWRPSPRYTEGGEYIPDIGSVGVYNHGLPFNTLFNMTQARDRPANIDGIPEGVDPPCVLGPRAITIEKEYHLPRTTFIQPEGAILEQGVQTNNESSDFFTFHLADAGGALLMVPHGGTLQKLEKTTEFKERVQLHWRQWYEFAGEQVDLDGGQVLCLVTGVERCSVWAMAAWDSMSSYAGGKPGSLELSVDNHTGACSWAFPPARCSTQSSTIPATNGNIDPRETIFIRGFWIDGLIGGLTSRSDTSSLRGENDNNGGDSGGTRGYSENAPSSSSSSSKALSSTHPSFSGGGRSGTSGQQRPDPPTNETQILEFDPDFLDGDEPAMVTNPCRVINEFAFELIARIRPTLLITGCAAFSHDEDWISIVNDSDEELPRGVEIIRRICLKSKFTIEGGGCHVSMPESDLSEQ